MLHWKERRAMRNYLQRGNRKQVMEHLLENDPAAYAEQRNIERRARSGHPTDDWDAMGNGCFHRKNHGLSDYESSGANSLRLVQEEL